MLATKFYFNLGYKNVSVHVNTSFTLKRDVINSVLANTLKSYTYPAKRKIDDLKKDAAIVPIESYNFWTESNRYNAVYPNPYNYHHNKEIDPFREAQTLFLEDQYSINILPFTKILVERVAGGWSHFESIS